MLYLQVMWPVLKDKYIDPIQSENNHKLEWKKKKASKEMGGKKLGQVVETAGIVQTFNWTC